MRPRADLLPLLLAASLAPSVAAADERSTLGVDAVELHAGRETPGDPAIHTSRGGFRYLFASAANRAAFEQAPEKYEIQFGGACARMGPLSGACSCNDYTVYAGKLYVFASAQCRAAFIKAPQRFLESDDDPPGGDAAARSRAQDLLELAVTRIGGAERVDALKTYRQRIEKTGEHQGRPTRETSTFTIAFPDRFRFDDTWNDSAWGHATDGAAGFLFATREDDRPMVASQVECARRIAQRHLLVILKARTQPGFVAAVVGSANVGDTPVERVACAVGGATTTLGIDPKSGEVRSISHPGRGPRSTLGLIEKTIIEYRTVDGLTLPWSWRVTFDGDAASAQTTVLAGMDVNPKLDLGLFKPGSRP